MIETKKRFFCALLLALLSVLCAGASAQNADEIQYAQTNCDANIRKDTSTRSEIAFVLEFGSRVVVRDIIETDTQTWCAIEVCSAPQRKGYVLRELLDFEPSALPETVLSAAPAEATGNSRKVDLSYYLAAVSQAEPALEDRFSEETLSSYEPLDLNDRGDAVLRLKNRLYELGYYAKEQTGPLYTESTRQTVARFQEINGLDADGAATPLTQAVLYSDFALGTDAETDDSRPVIIEDGRIVRYHSSSAVQIELTNHSRQTITGFSLQIIPYSTYSEPVALGGSLAEAVADSWSRSGILVNHLGKYDCVSKKQYFVISPGSFFGGALVSVSSYVTSDGVSVSIDPAHRHWYAIGTADASDLSLPEQILLSQADRARADAWSLGFSSSYVMPAWQQLYGAPEGAVVTHVDDFSYAAVAGLQAGDVILAVNATRITGEDSLAKAKSQIVSGDAFELIYWRSGSYFASSLIR